LSTAKNHQKIYDREKSKVEKKLNELLKGKQPKSLYSPCHYIISSGGKRIRAILILLSAKAVGAKYSSAYNAAAAVEILHNFTLVHDDIMDNADKRRGKPTLHIKYDVSTAILAGDNLIAIAYDNLLKDSPPNSKKILQTFTQGIIEVCEGQSFDKEFEVKKKVSIDEYLLMIQKKTAALAEMCCSIGAQIGGGSIKEINMLKKYGLNLGMAFQLQDDLLDIMGNEKEFGKKVGGDLIEGKRTYLFLKALEKAKGENKKALELVIKNKGIRKNQVKKYKSIYDDLGVIEDTADQVSMYTYKALRAIKNIDNQEAKEMLTWLANTLLKRKK
jgi:geranylgeranyl diphosphate synthase type II